MRRVAIIICIVLLFCSCGKNHEKNEESDSFYMGTYEQDNNSENGEEKIEWTILEESDGKRLVISSYTIDMMPIESAPGSRDCVDWADSEIRRWLNTEFLEKHFTEEERHRILDTEIEYVGGKTGDSFKINKVTDKVFYLSYDEAIKYFNQCRDNLMGKGMTDLAFYNISSYNREKIKNGTAVNDSKLSGLVTRDKGETEFDSPEFKGFLFWAIGNYYKDDNTSTPVVTCVNTTTRASVRPAMWISTEE